MAQLSKLCSTLASQGDLTCQNILIEASKHIVNLVKGLKGYFEEQPLVTFMAVCLIMIYLNKHFAKNFKSVLL